VIGGESVDFTVDVISLSIALHLLGSCQQQRERWAGCAQLQLPQIVLELVPEDRPLTTSAAPDVRIRLCVDVSGDEGVHPEPGTAVNLG
jgi:hypothetical protein